MDRLARILALHKIFSGAKVTISGKRIEEKLKCSEATRKKNIEEMWNHHPTFNSIHARSL